MADLSSVIAIAAVLDNSGLTPVLRIIDTSVYPGGVAPTVKGCLSVTQPDGITIANTNFASPDIQWTGSGLNPASLELRLNVISSFQTGGYSITYSVQATGYAQTDLTKTFTLQYTRPVVIISSNFDIFTPTLTVSDTTNYAQGNLSLVSLTDVWTGIIDSVGGTNQNIGTTGVTFSLAYLGQYYDANYDIELIAIPTWTISGNTWVTLADRLTLTQSFDSETPPTLSNLLSSLTFLKAQVDAAIGNCNTYPALLARYIKAQAIYSHLRYRGCDGSLSGLEDYVLELQKLFNNDSVPPVDHTDAVIPVYDFGCGASGSISWNSITGKPATVIIEGTIGSIGFPAGATFTDARLAGFNVLIMRNNIQEVDFTKLLASTTITFNSPLTATETIYIQTIPL